ncbi:MAG TPA: class I SAM-dependent methyltransferase [Candidatus Binataceae bacterium]|nr:class I SAM-dependent methyltransferase [Candidatus Binataceae bacterium]
MGSIALDQEKAASLTRQVSVDFGAALTVALAYIGDRLGIFKLMAAGPPMTSSEIAGRAGLNERYVREWAANMAAAGYLDYNPVGGTFVLTPEQASVLANEDTTFFMGGTFQYAVACYRQIAKLSEAFTGGGGVPFTDFGPEIVEAIERMFHAGYETWVAQEWIPAVPDVHQRLIAGAEVAEVGCGAGQCVIPVALAFPNSRFWGYDVDTTSIARARLKAQRAGVADRISFEQVSAEDLPARDRFDLVMAFNCIHDMARPRQVLASICRTLKSTGAFLWSEANAAERLEDNLNPRGRTLYGASTMHCMTVSLAQGGEGLGVVIGKEQARGMASEAGFRGLAELPVKNLQHRVFVARRS